MKRRIVLATTVFFGAIGFSTSASAQATRTWVSGVGDDVNPCSRTAPCKTFAGAISKTAAGGEINCLDPGGFGAVTIIKSMTISCPYTEGGALAGGNGVVVNLPAASDVVFLRGLDIFGVNPPTNGVRMVGLGTLHIEDCVIRRFNAANSAGVSIAPSGAATVYIRNTTIATNGNGATGGGLVIAPTGASGSAKITLDNVSLVGNANAAVRVDLPAGNTAPAGVQMTIRNSQLSGSTNGLTLNTPVGTTIAQANIFNSMVFNNQPGSGLVVNGANALIRAGANIIIGNGAAVQITGGSIRSFGDNVVEGNSNVSAFTPPNLTPL